MFTDPVGGLTMRQDRRKLLAIHLAAKNTPSGNPNRMYVLLTSGGRIVQAIDEGYRGWQAVADAGYPNAVQGPRFDTTATEIRETLKHHGKRSLA
jgi:hypothetical protein